MSMATPIKKVMIVGGGTAGWMTASFLAHSSEGGLEIQLIESDEIGIVGVGEATIPTLHNFNTALKINENEFVKATQASFKLGIEFRNWGALGDRYFHGFGRIGHYTGAVEFPHYWLKAWQEGKVSVEELDAYSINAQACIHNKYMRPSVAPRNSPLQHMGYAFHFDAGLYAKFLRGMAEKNGVRRTEGKIKEVLQDPQSGFVTGVKLESGEMHEAELFIDCSGFRGLLIEQTLGAGFEDWSHWLPCDRAMAVPCESSGPLTPFTRSTAHGAGWQWRIPLQHRVGNGHVYCSQYISDDEAAATLLKNLDGKALADPRPLKFKAGIRKKAWDKNVVAIGLSGGFMEPLESTSIHLIQRGITRLVGMFPNMGFAQVDQDEYNRQTYMEWELIRDFIILHYKATLRDDTPMWRYCREMPIPENLKRRIDLFRANGRTFREGIELFAEPSWFQVMFGQHIRPERYHGLVDTKTDQRVMQMLDIVRRNIERAANRMPTHETWIEKNCKAPMLEM